MYVQNFGGREIPYKNQNFFVTIEPNWMGFSTEMEIISYGSIILNHIQINSQF